MDQIREGAIGWQAFPAKSNTCKKGWSLPEKSTSKILFNRLNNSLGLDKHSSLFVPFIG
jgi:hypothetical protein